MKKLTAYLMIILTVLSCFSSSIPFFAAATFSEAEETVIYDDIERPEENPDAVIETAEDFFDFAELLSELVNEEYEKTDDFQFTADAGYSVKTFTARPTQAADDVITDDNSLLDSEKDVFTQKSKPSRSVYEKKADESNKSYKGTSPYQTKRLVVRTNDGALTQNYGARRIISDGQDKYILQFESEEDTKKAFDFISTLDSVDSVSIDSVVTISATESPLTEGSRNRWGAERIESDRYKSYLSENEKNSSVVVAVVDTGVEMNHPFLENRLLSTGYDFIKSDSIADDENMHGTHCSGIIVDNTPDTVKILPVKSFNSGGSSTDTIIALGIDYAVAKGADIISMSFGGFCNNDNCEIAVAIKKAVKAGVVCVVAAGNEAEDTSGVCPARLEECITVSSVDSTDKLSDFSNYGNSVDIAAPGENIWSSTIFKNGTYEAASGTSMATPFVSAAAAMFLTDNPDLSVNQLKSKVKDTTVDLGIKGEDKAFGAGVLDFGVLFSGKTSATSISTKENTITLYKSDTIGFDAVPVTVTVSPMSAQDKSYTVNIKDSTIASFDGFGFKAKKAGETTVTFTLANGKSATVKIKCVNRRFWIDYASKSFSGGEGTRNNPYLVSTAEELARIAFLGNQNKLRADIWFKQTADIDLSGKTWYPILGRDSDGLITRVNYDGNGYDITNLQISNISSDAYIYYSGLFAVNNGEMKNINIIDADINCPDSNDSGAICAYFGGVMKNCYVSGKVKGLSAGGLVGSMSATNENISHLSISNCRSDATVTATDYAGGITGTLSNGHIENCVFTGTADARETGGIVGVVAVSSGTVTGDYEYGDCRIANCISTENLIGTVYSRKNEGADLVPYVYSCYYSGEYENGINEISGEYTDFNNIEKVDANDLKTASFYSEKNRWYSSSPWDLSTTWKISNSYPALANQKSKIVYSQFDYYEHDGTIIVNGYYGKNPHMVIPSTLEGKPVTAIGSMFVSHNVDVKKITLPNSVKLISACAFENPLGRINKSLTSVKLGSGIEHIDARAFLECSSLSYIVIPASLKILDASAFALSGISYVFFEGDAIKINPNAFAVTNAKIYYKNGTSGWTKVKNSGISVKAYNPSVPVVAVADFNGEEETYVKYGSKVKLGITVLPTSASGAKLTYSVPNNSFSVDSNGYLTTSSKTFDDCIVTVKYNGKRIGSTIVSTVTSAQNYTVNFKGNNATSGSMKSQSISYYLPTALSSNAFKKTGYRFTGWTNKSSSKTILATNKEKVSKLTGKGKSITLYALWTPIDYTIKFDANGGSGKMSSQTISYNSSIKLPKNTFTAPTGKVFAGWSRTPDGSVKYTNAQSVKNLSTTHNEKVTLYAVWVKAGTFKVTYNPEGGTMPSEYLTSYKSGTLTQLPVPTRNGYDFESWYLDSAKTQRITKIPTYYAKNIKLYAKWTPHKYSVSFSANGGTGKMSTQTSFTYDTKKRLADCTFTAPKGKVFAGWATSKTGSPLYYNKQNVKNLTSANGKTVKLYAVWITPKTYSIKYYTNGGTLEKGAKTTYKTGTGYVLPDATRAGYTFLGWYTSSTLDKGKISIIKPWNTGTVKLYAKWEAHKYSVSFSANGGTGKMSTQTGFTYGTKKKLADCTFTAPKGKVFAGWATSTTGSPLYYNEQNVKNLTSANGKTVKLYAVWITPKTYSIKYYTNGGTLEKGAKTTYKTGTGYVLPDATRAGYTFLGWYTSSTLDKGKISIIKPWNTGTVKLYAKWKKV